MNLKYLILITAFSQTAWSTVYYMSPTGNDANSGKSTSLPWKSIDRLHAAQSILKPGDTVYFRGGNYLINDSSRRDMYALTASGTSSARITYKNYNGERVFIVVDRRRIGTDFEIWRNPLKFSGDYTTFDGINFRLTEQSRLLAANGTVYTNRDGMQRGTTIEGAHVRVQNCSFDNFSGLSIAAPGAYTLVENCVFTNGANHYLYLQGAYGTFRNNTMNGSRQTEGARPVQIQYVTTHHNKVYNNLILNGAADGVVFSGRVSYNEVYNNIIINSGIGRPAGFAMSVWCEDGPVGVGNKFYNNTIMGKVNEALIGDVLTPKCGSVRPLSRVEVRDNIFYPSSAKPVGTVQSYSLIKNNIFYNISGAVPANNIKGKNPLLANPTGLTASSAMLKTGSPAINAGLSSIFPKTDFKGSLRPVRYDIGAYEF